MIIEAKVVIGWFKLQLEDIVIFMIRSIIDS